MGTRAKIAFKYKTKIYNIRNTHVYHARGGISFFTTNRNCNTDIKNSTCETIAIKIMIIINRMLSDVSIQ